MRGFKKGTDVKLTFNIKKEFSKKLDRFVYVDDNGKEFEINDIVVVDLENDNSILVVNSKSIPINISHFQGTSRERYTEFMSRVSNNSDLSSFPEDLTIITVFTDKESCILYKQLEKFNISCINAYDFCEDKNKEWFMPDKVSYILKALDTVKTTYALILDGYDVLINSFDNILYKFKQTNLKMLYNSTKNNFPNVYIDKIHDRDWRGEFRFFNAGCAIGYTNEFKKFYQDCLDLIPFINNPFSSEQFVLRNIFAKYSEKVDTKDAYIDFDWQCNIFQTYINTSNISVSDNIFAII